MPCSLGLSPVLPTNAPCWAGQLGTNTWRGGDRLECCSEESRRSAAVRGQRGDRRGGLLCPRVLYVPRSELKEISPEAVDVSSFDEAKRVASVAEEERRIIEAERRWLSLDA